MIYKVVCPNCGYEFIKDENFRQIDICPKCNTPLIGSGVDLMRF